TDLIRHQYSREILEGWQAFFYYFTIAALCTYSFQNSVLLSCTTHSARINCLLKGKWTIPHTEYLASNPE
ncbi:MULTISPECIES: hypothetical protein, partial [unclassified Sporosarcina]|uniref:hypothetical protein n=1 Tax=unclassified Sporosarcina TaxID=2647733 RepID=UPI001E417FFC